MLLGFTLLVFLLNGWPFLVLCIGLLGRGADLSDGGISYVELLILYENWAGERLSLEKAVPRTSNFSVKCSFWSRH